MNGSPAFQFYPADYLADGRVQSMSIEGEGCYIRLMCYCWREGFIPVDREAIAKLCKGYSGPGIDEALSCFSLTRKRDHLIHKRLEAERSKQEKFHKSMQDAGLRGSRKRWGSYSLANDKPIAKNGSSSSSSSSPSSIKDKEKNTALESEFNQFWEAYPWKEGKTDARKAFLALRHAGVQLEDLAAGVNGYLDYLKHEKIKNNFERRPKMAATLLRNDRWKEYAGFKYQPPL